MHSLVEIDETNLLNLVSLWSDNNYHKQTKVLQCHQLNKALVVHHSFWLASCDLLSASVFPLPFDSSAFFTLRFIYTIRMPRDERKVPGLAVSSSKMMGKESPYHSFVWYT